MDAIGLPSITDLADTYQLEELARQADVLSPVSAAIMEEILEQNPLDLLNRARLLGFYYRYYWRRRTKFAKQYRENRTKHILWFIENAPDCRFAGDTYFSVDKQGDEQNYSKVTAAWHQRVKEARNRQVSINAALFFFRHEPNTCLKLLGPILKMDPSNAWALEIANLLESTTKSERTDDFSDLASAVPEDEIKNLTAVCDSSYLRQALTSGEFLSPISERTLNRVVSAYPSDVTARAELLGFYGKRCERFNLLGRDPEYERLFATHLLWFITHAPAARDLSEVRIPELSARTLAQLQNRWSQQKRDSRMETNASKLLHGKTKAEERNFARARRKWGVRTTVAGALDDIAIEPDQVTCGQRQAPSTTYSLTEWANNCSMGHAELTGSYAWLAPDSIDHLEKILDERSIDLYNRAKIIGYYRESVERTKECEDLRAVFIKQLHWLISNVPDCEFLKEFYWEGLETDAELNAQTKKLWLETARRHRKSGVYINAALAHFKSDPSRARSLVVSALKLEPGQLMAEALLGKLDRRPKRSSSRVLLRKHNFVAGRKSDIISRASKRISITGAWLLGGRSPDRSVWTAEQVIHNNPNELGLRAELLGFYSAHRYCFALSSRDPKLSADHLPHQLWLIARIPETIGANVRGSYYLDPTGYRALVMAWKDQLDAYPNNASIAYGASWIFSGDSRFFNEGMAMIKRAIKLHPNDKRLKERLKQLKHLAGIRSR